MCIISGPVLSVNNTKILVLPSRNRRRQLTVYRNAVDTPDSNMMCLPVPNPNTVKFEHVPKDIFKQCDNSFAKEYRQATLSARSWSSGTRSALPVLSHGSYDVVLVPSMSDFDRIPSPFNTLTEDVITFLTQSYPPEFGIVLCRLKQGHSDYEPFAYSHDIQTNGKLFFPTKHYHVESSSHLSDINDNGDNNSWDFMFGKSLLGTLIPNSHSMARFSPPSRNIPKVVTHKYADDWDHELYSAGTDQREHSSEDKRIQYGNVIEWEKMPAEFQLSNTVSLRCKEIVGEYPNKDIEMILV